MAINDVNQVCDSWEELIKDSPTESPTNSNDKSNCSFNPPEKNKAKKKDLSYSSALNKNSTGQNNIKILNRNGSTSSTNNTPRNIQIKFEDNSVRNQFLPQQNITFKILQRPKEQSKNENMNGLIRNGFHTPKTIQEREAEYAKARLRILGANYSNDLQESSSNQSQPLPITNQLNRDDLMRMPQGPQSCSMNFMQRR